MFDKHIHIPDVLFYKYQSMVWYLKQDKYCCWHLTHNLLLWYIYLVVWYLRVWYLRYETHQILIVIIELFRLPIDRFSFHTTTKVLVLYEYTNVVLNFFFQYYDMCDIKIYCHYRSMHYLSSYCSRTEIEKWQINTPT